MSYRTVNSVYLVQFMNGPLVLWPYFELDEEGVQFKHVDFVIKFKEGLVFDIKECEERKGFFTDTYTNTVKFNDILTVDNIERFKLSQSLWSKESYLKQIYDGKSFDMTKLNDIVMISSDFLQDGNLIELEETKTTNEIKKKLPNYVWVTIILIMLLIAYLFYEYNYKKV